MHYYSNLRSRDSQNRKEASNLIQTEHRTYSGFERKSENREDISKNKSPRRYVANHSQRPKFEMRDRSITDPKPGHYKNVTMPDNCVTSPTSSGIGSMKSSTVSVTMGSPPIRNHLTNTGSDNGKRHHKLHDKNQKADASPTRLWSREDKQMIVHKAPSVVHRTANYTNDDEIFQLTDAEDADTSGIFSMSEATPQKKHNSSVSQSKKKGYTYNENFEKIKIADSCRDKMSAPEQIIVTEITKDTLSPISDNCSGKSSPLYRQPSSDRATPSEKCNLQIPNTGMGIKRERLDSEGQRRRKGNVTILRI